MDIASGNLCDITMESHHSRWVGLHHQPAMFDDRFSHPPLPGWRYGICGLPGLAPGHPEWHPESPGRTSEGTKSIDEL